MDTRAQLIAPYERLVKLIELELELAAQGCLTELESAVTERGRYLASLTLPAPGAAEPLLLRARALHSRVTIETRRLGQAVEARRHARQRARQMARTYVPAPSLSTYSTSA